MLLNVLVATVENRHKKWERLVGQLWVQWQTRGMGPQAMGRVALSEYQVRH